MQPLQETWAEAFKTPRAGPPRIRLYEAHPEVAAGSQGNQYGSREKLPGEWWGPMMAGTAVSDVQNAVVKAKQRHWNPAVPAAAERE